MKGIFKYSSQHLRIWNEVATIFLVAIVMLAVVKQNVSVVWGLIGLIAFVLAEELVAENWDLHSRADVSPAVANFCPREKTR